MNPETEPHRRYNPLEDSWVLVSPHRTARPWLGEETSATQSRPSYDKDCYLCPGNQRAVGLQTPDYDGVFVFDNDFPALLPATETLKVTTGSKDPLFQLEVAAGRCRVICYSPQHDLSLGHLDQAALQAVVETWIQEYQQLSTDFTWVQIFENRGAAMGASNPHPHGQVWAVDHLPSIAFREQRAQSQYLLDHDSLLLLDYAEQEVANGERAVYQNDEWLVVVPYWASWPFETLLLPRSPVAHIGALSAAQQRLLVQAIGQLQLGYDAVFDCEFPYSFGWHNAPSGTEIAQGWQLHAHFYPPLLRSASIKKFMVGYEMLAEPQRDLTPELAAQGLRDALGGINKI